MQDIPQGHLPFSLPDIHKPLLDHWIDQLFQMNTKVYYLYNLDYKNITISIL